MSDPHPPVTGPDAPPPTSVPATTGDPATGPTSPGAASTGAAAGGSFPTVVTSLGLAVLTTVGVVALQLPSTGTPTPVPPARAAAASTSLAVAPNDSVSLEPVPTPVARQVVVPRAPIAPEPVVAPAPAPVPAEVAAAPAAAPAAVPPAAVAAPAPTPATASAAALLPAAPAAAPTTAPMTAPAATSTTAPDPAARTAPAPAPTDVDPAAGSGRASTPVSFTVGSFNVLGSQHSRPGGQKPRFPPASQRTRRAAALMKSHGVDLIGTQELQDDQLRDVRAATGMAAYPGMAWGRAETDNSVLWDPDVFELVSGRRFAITFVGRSRPQPVVRLRHRASGQELYVVNTHPSPGTGKAKRERRRAQATVVRLVRSLRTEGLPVLVTGDMNDREEFFCRVVRPAGLRAANGGSTRDGCRPPEKPVAVDWVAGRGVRFSQYERDTSSVEQRTSDHFFISARATVR